MGEFMLSGLSGEDGMSSLSLTDLNSRDQSENTYNPIVEVQGAIAWAPKHFVKCTTIAMRYQVGRGKNPAF